jgi:hypothetical protein
MYSKIGKKTLQKIDAILGKKSEKLCPNVIKTGGVDARTYFVEPGSQEDLHGSSQNGEKSYEW